MSQINDIKNHIETIGSLSALEAVTLYGCFRLAARIYDLKQLGFEYSKKMETNGKARYAVYSK